MPRFRPHLIISGVTGAMYSIAIQKYRKEPNLHFNQQVDLVHVLACAAAAALGGCVPDLLEPADRIAGPNHRGAFHSLAAGGLAAKAAFDLAVDGMNSADRCLMNDLAGAFWAGYGSHLIADALTPQGLKLFCKEI